MGKQKLRREKGEIKIRGRKRGVIWWSRPSTISILIAIVAIVLMTTGFTLAGVPVIWMVWYRISPETSTKLAQVLAKPLGEGQTWLSSEAVSNDQVSLRYQPPLDTALPKENRLIIKSIGVDTQIWEEPTPKYEQALKQGVWRVPDFGTAKDRKLPMIMVAHRFGYLAWSNTYRRENSFFNLPKLKPGDTIQVIWNQREYTYQVYAGDEGTEISNYQADLILYTCKFLESDVRIFRYAKLLTN